MELEFVAFSRNKISPSLVEEHLMHMLDINIEPNVMFFLRVLQKTDVNQVGSMSYDDFGIRFILTVTFQMKLSVTFFLAHRPT